MNEAGKLILTGLASSKCGNEVFGVSQAEKFLMMAASTKAGYRDMINKGADPFDALSLLTETEKNAVIAALERQGLLTSPGYHKGILPHYFDVSVKPIETCKTFPTRNNTKLGEFKVELPINPLWTFVGPQYLHIKTKLPKLATKYGDLYDLTDPNLKYRYTVKPGIRAIKEMVLKSNDVDVQPYKQIDVLRFDKEMVQDNIWESWNDLIQHDLGKESVVYNQFLNAEIMTKVRVGHQTPKHDQEVLDLLIPIFFDFNQCFDSKLNTASTIPGTLHIEGKLEFSHNMVQAQLYDDDVTVDPITLDCEPLGIDEFSLVTVQISSTDVVHSLYALKNKSSFVRYWDSRVYTIPDCDTCEMIPLKGESNTEAYTVAVRPRSYNDDFDKWVHLSEVRKLCVSCPVLTPQNQVLNNIAVLPSISFLETAPLEKISLMSGEYILKSEMPILYYGSGEQYRVGSNHSRFRPRSKELYKFNFDYFYKNKILTGSCPQGKMAPVHFCYKFKDEYVGEGGILDDEWEFIIFRDIFNKQIGIDSNIVTRYPL